MRRCCIAFDLIEHDGADLRDLPLIERKRRLARLIGRAKRQAIRFIEHLTDDGPTVFEHVCRMGLEGIVSKRMDAPYRSGPSKDVAQVEEPGERGGAPGARADIHDGQEHKRSVQGPDTEAQDQSSPDHHIRLAAERAKEHGCAQMDCAEMGRLLMIAALAAPAPMGAY